MTNRNYIRPYSAGVTVKRPRINCFDLNFDGPPPPTPEGVNNGMRPHGGYRGNKPLPPGQFSFNKDDTYQQEIEEEYNILVSNENYEVSGAPYWVNDVQREITHSGESPLFTNKLLATGKFEQEHGIISFERALLHGNKRRLMSAPRRRHLNGRKEFYRPNSTHQYLSATDLRNLNDNEENMIKYGRPTRTTLLRARQRTNSAPVNAYDLRRENVRRTEDVKNNSIFTTSKEYFNIYASDGQTMHSFLTGARYNRAHLLDSKGLTVYGVYMPRENPTDCFIAGPRRMMKGHGDEMPSAPPDSPRSDTDETMSPPILSRPTSSKISFSRPSSSSRPGSNRPSTKQSSRPPSLRKSQSRIRPSRPRSGKDHSPTSTSTRSFPLKPDSPKKELPLPNEVTLEMPDHINKGKAGVYVTLKGQKFIESVDSKLPRVTGVSLPKIRKSPRDAVDEFMYANQPPPTPVELSAVGQDKNRYERSNSEGRSFHHIDERVKEEETENPKIPPSTENAIDENKATTEEAQVLQEVDVKEEIHTNNSDTKDNVISEVVEVENQISDRKSLEIGPIKKVNFSDLHIDTVEQNDDETKPEIDAVAAVNEISDTTKDEKALDEKVSNEKVPNDNVIFFVTEQEEETIEEQEVVKENANQETIENVKDKVETGKDKREPEKELENKETNDSTEETNGNDSTVKSVADVIKVEISETEKQKENIVKDNNEEEVEETQPVTSEEYPFDNKAD